MKKALILSTALSLLLLTISPVHALTTIKIPNSSFENWTQTTESFLPNRWILESGNAKNITRSVRTSDGQYSLQFNSPATISSETFDVSGPFKINLFAYGDKGTLKVFRQADGLNPVCKLSLPTETSKNCNINLNTQGHKYYVSLSSESFFLLVDNLSLLHN